MQIIHKLSYLFFILTMLPKLVYSAQWAVVSARVAIVYSDITMSSKIGVLKRGQRIRVGDVPRNKGKLLPFLLGKKVAYIKIKDLSSSRERVMLRSKRDLHNLTLNTGRKNKQLKDYSVSYEAFFSDLETISFSDRSGTKSSLTFHGTQFFFVDRVNEDFREYGIGHLYGRSSESELEFITANFTYLKKIFEVDKYHAYSDIGATLSPYLQFSNIYQEKTTSESTSYAYGGHLGVAIGSEVKKNLVQVLLGSRFKYLRIGELSLKSSDGNSKNFSPSLFGLSFYIRVNFKI